MANRTIKWDSTNKRVGINVDDSESLSYNLQVNGTANISSLTLNTALPVDQGGTGASNAADARVALGLGDSAGALPITVAQGGTGLTSSPSIRVNLGSTSTANIFVASPRPGVQGVLDVANGGTGLSTISTGYALIGNGTSAIATREIVNNTTVSDLGWDSKTSATRLITQNTLAYWNGEYKPGNSNITHLGTVSSGIWNGTIIGLAYGGTGASSASAARTNLGIVNASYDTTGLVNTSSQEFSGIKTFRNNGRYPTLRLKPEHATNNGSDSYGPFCIYLDSGSTSVISKNRVAFRCYSPTSNSDTTYTSSYEEYRLPSCDVGKSSNDAFSIVTTKNRVVSLYSGKLKSGSQTLSSAVSNYSFLLVFGIPYSTESIYYSQLIPISLLTTTNKRFGIVNENYYVTFDLKKSSSNIVLAFGATNGSGYITDVYGII